MLDDLGLIGGALVLAVMAGEGGVKCQSVDAPEVARATRVHPHVAVIAAHHLLDVVERDAPGAVHRPGPIHQSSVGVGAVPVAAGVADA
jgi:hypothetical protein